MRQHRPRSIPSLSASRGCPFGDPDLRTRDATSTGRPPTQAPGPTCRPPSWSPLRRPQQPRLVARGDQRGPRRCGIRSRGLRRRGRHAPPAAGYPRWAMEGLRELTRDYVVVRRPGLGGLALQRRSSGGLAADVVEQVTAEQVRDIAAHLSVELTVPGTAVSLGEPLPSTAEMSEGRS